MRSAGAVGMVLVLRRRHLIGLVKASGEAIVRARLEGWTWGMGGCVFEPCPS